MSSGKAAADETRSAMQYERVNEWTEYGPDANVTRRVRIINGKRFYIWRVWSKYAGTMRVGANCNNTLIHQWIK